MRIDRRVLIEFFHGDDDTRSHQAAIKAVAGEELGLALLVEFLSDQRRNPTRVPGMPHPAGGAGHHLDGWVRAQADDGLMTLYQVEVKLWGRYSFLHQGQQPPHADRLVQRWTQYWDQFGFRDEELRKVLDENMELPEGNTRVEPLVCLWDAVCPCEEVAPPWFSVPVPEFPVEVQRQWVVVNPRRFTRVWIFSMSAFLETLDDGEELTLDLPATSERLQWLNRIFPHA